MEEIVNRFSALNPYDPTFFQGSILKIEPVSFDSTGQKRLLHGYSISAKRYALYEQTGIDLTIVDPKAHGLGYLYPPKENYTEADLDWIFEVWNWLLREALGLPRKAPAWLNLPTMMRIVASTPHVLRRLNGLTRPYSFLLCPLIDSVAGYPAGVDRNNFTLVAPFSNKRERWLKLECINIRDGKPYHLALQQSTKLDRVIPQTFGYVLRLYTSHPESKSLAPDGTPCSRNTTRLCSALPLPLVGCAMLARKPTGAGSKART